MNLVVGATGNVGGGVCEALRGRSKPVRALVRETSDPERVGRLEELGAEVVRGELRDSESLIRWCKKDENRLALLQLACGLIAFKKARTVLHTAAQPG
jgi:uncharacterized protein YbjT (DUF2867 family)